MPEPCPICGHPDSQSRYRGAVQSRYEAGESRESLMHDYGLSPEQLAHVLNPESHRDDSAPSPFSNQGDVMPQLNAREAINGFAGWLTTLDEPTIFSAHHDASIIVERIAAFCDVNELDDTREGWGKWLRHPGDLPPIDVE